MTPRPFPLVAFFSLLLGGVAIGFAGILMRLSDVNPLANGFRGSYIVGLGVCGTGTG